MENAHLRCQIPKIFRLRRAYSLAIAAKGTTLARKIPYSPLLYQVRRKIRKLKNTNAQKKLRTQIKKHENLICAMRKKNCALERSGVGRAIIIT